ncbi:MAG: hypothetical protein ABJA35_15830 [Parafilimonas sp.]
MNIIELQEQIEMIRTCLTNGIENYMAAIQKNMEFERVEPLFKKIKSIMVTLRSAMIKYEKLITDDMNMFTTHKNEQLCVLLH